MFLLRLTPLAVLFAASAFGAVTIERVPNSGLQPSAMAESDGTVHLVYLTGDPKLSDIHYRRRSAQGEWTAPVRVNSQPGSAVAIGTIRGPQLAIGRNGNIHVAWNGSDAAKPKPINGGVPLLYARLSNDGKSFSPQQNLMGTTRYLDGGGSITADEQGRVFVVWHAATAKLEGETNRAVFLALSRDDGATFAPERVVSPAGLGACGCCGLTTMATRGGDEYVLFRSARSLANRDMTLLTSTNGGANFVETFAHPWSIRMCPMSSASLAGSEGGLWAAWETGGKVQFARFAENERPSGVREIGMSAKHPRLAINPRGEGLIVWTEGAGWERGGSFAWQPFDARGESTAEPSRHDGIPTWSFATVHARPDGSFAVLY